MVVGRLGRKCRQGVQGHEENHWTANGKHGRISPWDKWDGRCRMPFQLSTERNSLRMRSAGKLTAQVVAARAFYPRHGGFARSETLAEQGDEAMSETMKM